MPQSYSQQRFFQPSELDFPAIQAELQRDLQNFFRFLSFNQIMNNSGDALPILFIKVENLRLQGFVFEYEILIQGTVSQEDFIVFAKQALLDEYLETYIEEQNLAFSSNSL